MSAKPWSTTAAPPYGFRVTIERVGQGVASLELHTFPSKTPRRNAAIQAASYKKDFLRVVTCEPLTREAWDREFGKAKA